MFPYHDRRCHILRVIDTGEKQSISVRVKGISIRGLERKLQQKISFSCIKPRYTVQLTNKNKMDLKYSAKQERISCIIILSTCVSGSWSSSCLSSTSVVVFSADLLKYRSSLKSELRRFSENRSFPHPVKALTVKGVWHEIFDFREGRFVYLKNVNLQCKHFWGNKPNYSLPRLQWIFLRYPPPLLPPFLGIPC